MTGRRPPRSIRSHAASHCLALIGSVVVSIACSGERKNVRAANDPVVPDCSHVDTAGLSSLAIDAFQRDLAIDTPKRLVEHLDRYPELICHELQSERYGSMSPIAYAAGHRPDAHAVFGLLIERGASVADALPVAVWRGDSRVVPWLLDKGVDPNTQSAIVLAAHQRDTRMVERLLDAGADPSRPLADNPWIDSNGQTALHYAARHGLQEMLRALVDAGAEVNAIDDEGRTPLSEAVMNSDPGTVRRLFDLGAAPTRMRSEDVDRLHRIATTYGMQDIVQFLE